MKKRLLTVLLAAGLLASATLTAWTIPAAAQQQVWVQLPTGEVVPVDVPPGTDPNDMQLQYLDKKTGLEASTKA